MILNGHVIRSLEADGQHLSARINFTPEHSGWIAVRVFGPPSPDLPGCTLPGTWEGRQFAHTSPIYIEVPGNPLPPDRDAAEYFVSWLDAYRAAVHAREDLFHNENGTWGDDVKARILQRITEARKVFAGLRG